MTCSCRTARSRRSAAWRPTTRRWVASRMKLVGGDSGRAEHEHFVEDVVLAPSERAVVDVLFEQPGEFVLEHRTPEKTYRLGAVTVADERAEPSLPEQFEVYAAIPSSRLSVNACDRGSTRSRTRRWPSWPRWTSTPSRVRPFTSARCTSTWSHRSPAAAQGPVKQRANSFASVILAALSLDDVV